MGPVTDGLMATAANADYSESFAVSAAQDPGARHLGCLALGLIGTWVAWSAAGWAEVGCFFLEFSMGGCTPHVALPPQPSHRATPDPPLPAACPPAPAGVLNRAEWVKFVALFFNQERAASDIFTALKAEYEATKVKS